jgi:hypothetical protein
MNSFGQNSVRDSSIAFPMIGVTAAYQLPSGDMAKRFGNDISVGGLFLWKLKNNWIFGLEGNFFFSEDVKENGILDKYKTADGNIISGEGIYSTVNLSERGMKFELKAGKIIPVIGPNPNSGLFFCMGAGMLQHKILIETPGSPIPYLEGEYAKGYDRLSNGFCFTAFAGYINFSNHRLSNFFGGFEFTNAFTQSRREMNFDTGLKDETKRNDILIGLRVGWFFPLYKRSTDKFYTN